jgi:hypothetical protein
MQKFDHNIVFLRKTPIFSPKIGKKCLNWFVESAPGRRNWETTAFEMCDRKTEAVWPEMFTQEKSRIVP